MISMLQMLVFAGAVLLLGGAGAMLRMLRLRDRQRALQKRIDSVSSPHVRSRAEQLGTITRRRVREPRPFVRKITDLFGYDAASAEAGLRWYLVLPVTLSASFAGAQLMQVLLGNIRMLAVPVMWVMLSRSVWGWWRDRRLALLLSQFPDALSMIVRSVRVGIPVSEAVRVVARETREPTARSFGELANEVAIGVPLEVALRQLAARTGLTEYRFFATAIALQTQTGGALSETLENLADVIRRRIALKSRGRALSSEARASTAVLVVLPLLMGGAMYVMNPAYIGVLFYDPTGRKALGLATVSLVVGLLTMRTIINKVLS